MLCNYLLISGYRVFLIVILKKQIIFSKSIDNSVSLGYIYVTSGRYQLESDSYLK